MKLKVCYIMSFVEFSQQFADIDAATDSGRYELSYIFLSPQIPTLQKLFAERGREVAFIEYRSKKDLPRATAQIFKLLGTMQPDIVHTHLVDASLAGLLAAKLKNIKRRVHTRHHSIENHEYHPHGIYYDKIINRLSPKIIAISNVVRRVLTEKEAVNPQKIQVIEHGFDFGNYNFSPEDVAALKAKYGLTAAQPIVGVISRFVHWKGVQFIIPAFKKLSADYPQAKLVLANARGDYAEEIKQLLSAQLDPTQYVLIEFEKQFIELYKMFDVFVHVPINPEFEAFGQTYIEALALEIPSIFTLSGIANDFIVDRQNALVVPFQDAEAIYNVLKLMLDDGELRKQLIAQAQADVAQRFGIQRMVNQLDELYRSL